MGGANALPTASELDRMRALLREALRQGARGFSTGLSYAPGATAPVNPTDTDATRLDVVTAFPCTKVGDEAGTATCSPVDGAEWLPAASKASTV